MRGCRATPPAKSVIFLFMCGGVSHIDTFDPKDNKHAGKIMDAIGFGDNNAPMKRPVIPILRTFKQYGKSGIPVSDWFPNVGEVIDDIAVVRSMYCHQTNHFPAVLEGATGKPLRQFEHPSPGQLGVVRAGHGEQESADVREHRPAFVAGAIDGRYLGASYSATPFQPGDTPIPEPASAEELPTAQERDRQMQALFELNKQFRADYATESEIAARVASLRTGGQHDAESAGDRGLLDRAAARDGSLRNRRKETDDFGRQLLLARRLAENGVRFIQICHAGGGNGGWDAHDDMKSHGPLCRAVDKPISGLIRDLKQRGMLDSTLVVFTSEFGRTPWSQNTTGRDHNAHGLYFAARRRRRERRRDRRRHRRGRLSGGGEAALHQRSAIHDPAAGGSGL